MLLQNEYKIQLTKLNSEIIDQLYARLSPLNTTCEKNLKEHLEGFSKAILIRKEKKYWRDKNAFSEGHAYNWNQERTF